MRTPDPFDACAVITRQAGRNFGAGYLFLDAETRRAMNALYSFARLSDDIADDPLPGLSPDDEARERARQFAAWRTGLALAWDGDDAGHPVLGAIAQVGRARGLSRSLLEEIIAGCESDLAVTRYPTYAGLYAYIEKVAVAVGLAMLEIFQARRAETEKPMRSLGEAFQLTNILRDIPEDHARGRIYLAQEDMARHGVAEADIAAAVEGGAVAPPFVALLAEYSGRARACYRASDYLFTPAGLPPGPRKSVRAMRFLYEAILDRIADDPAGVFRVRPRLTTVQKVSLLLKASAA